MSQPQPELEWLRREFNLGDTEYARVVELHKGYLPGCAERCRLIEEQNAKLASLLKGASSVTPEIQAVIAKRGGLRAECEAEMLKHFLEVSRTMPPEQGRRYLVWVEQQTFMRDGSMERQHRASDGDHPHH